MRRAFVGLMAVAASAAAAVPAAAENKAAVGRADCARLMRHVPDAGVAYAPGIDVHGRPVAPADLDGSAAVALPAEIAVAVGVDLAKRLNLPGGAGVAAEAPLVRIVVKEDGRAYVGDRPLTSDEQAALVAACRRAAVSR